MRKQAMFVLVLLLAASAGARQPSAKELSGTFIEVVKQVNPAVVTITSERIVKRPEMRFRHPFEDFFGEDLYRHYFGRPEGEYRSQVLGSGVIVNVDNGHILTSNHVVEGADEITILLMDEREFRAEIVGTDAPSDLAVLKIEADNLVGAKLGNSDELEVGEWVLAIGSPFSKNLSHTVTAGIVSAKGRSHILGGISSYEDFIQTDAAINPGNSGGALMNLDGELVGINTAIATGGYSRGNVGVGFAIPINLAKRIMTDLIAQGRVIRAWLGVGIQDVEDVHAKALGLRDRQGVLVTDVVKDSPAEQAGIRIGDVIVEFDGKKVRDSAHLKNVVSGSRPGTHTTVEVVRKKRYKTLTVALTEFPDEQTLLSSSKKESPHLGLSVENISPDIAKRYNLDEDARGVIVVEVRPNSVAARAGIWSGDLILRVGDREIKSRGDVRRAMKDQRKNETILFLIKRRGNNLFVAVETQ